jgi:predicted RNA polymerase sigma factor
LSASVPSDIHHTIEAVWRIELAKIIARLARMVGDIELAEDLAQDVQVIALEHWPELGKAECPR